jgi:hypothetical protein
VIQWDFSLPQSCPARSRRRFCLLSETRSHHDRHPSCSARRSPPAPSERGTARSLPGDCIWGASVALCGRVDDIYRNRPRPQVSGVRNGHWVAETLTAVQRDNPCNPRPASFLHLGSDTPQPADRMTAQIGSHRNDWAAGNSCKRCATGADLAQVHVENRHFQNVGTAPLLIVDEQHADKLVAQIRLERILLLRARDHADRLVVELSFEIRA